MGRYLPTGIVKGLGVTGGTMLRTIFPDPKKPIPNPVKGADTVQYPHEKEAPPTRARGVIALHEENCTACMLCARECPDWCIYIEGHKEKAPPRRAGGKPRQKILKIRGGKRPDCGGHALMNSLFASPANTIKAYTVNYLRHGDIILTLPVKMTNFGF